MPLSSKSMMAKRRSFRVRSMFGILLLILYIVLPDLGRAEVYQGIGPFETLATVQAKFPNAEFKRISPAWAQSTDIMYSVSGPGLPGTLVVKFTDRRPYWKEQLASCTDSTLIPILRELAYSTDTAIEVDWVRWLPDKPIALKRVLAKYGAPDSSGFANQDLQPFRGYVKRGLVVYLDDEEKHAVRFDFQFTAADYRAARMAMNLKP